MIRVADYIMQRLVQAGVGHLFMVTGRGILYLSDAAAKEEKLSCISVHHEQGGAYAAMAYAQANNKIGACLVSTGCAATNAITPLLCAWQDDVPMIVISGQNTLKETTRHTGLPIRTFGQQEADIISLVKPITKYAVMISDPSQIGVEMDKALFLANSGRKGPVWIDIPVDVQNMRIEENELERFLPASENFPAQEDVLKVSEMLQTAQRPVILIGSGVRSAGAEKVLAQFVEKYPIPVVYTSSAVDIYKSDNDLSIGAVGTMAANRAANFTLQNADFVLIIGSRMTTMTTGTEPDKFAREAKIIAVDIDKNEYRKGNLHVEQFILSDAKVFLEKIIRQNFTITWQEWLEKCRHYKKIFPKCEEKYKNGPTVDLYYLAEKLSSYMDKDAVFITDAGLEELIMPTSISFKNEQRCLQPTSQGAMGYALPATMGAWYSTQKQVVAVIGDGSMMMNLQELQTIKHNNIPVKIIIANNNCYAVIRKRQIDLFRNRTIGTDGANGISCPNYAKVAECFGLFYCKISSPEELDEKLSVFLAIDGPGICEVMCSENQEYICTSYVRTAKGRFVQRPLEDQSPFLKRELFLSEMIISPIDQ